MKFFLLCCFIFYTQQSLCQQSVIILKRGEGYKELKKFEKEGSHLTIRISGYNPFATKLNGNGKDIDLSYEVPSLFGDLVSKTLVMPNVIDLSEKNITGLNKDFYNQFKAMISDSTETMKTEINPIEECRKSFICNYTEFLENLQNIYSLYLIEDFIKGILDNPELQKNTAETSIQRYIASVSSSGNPEKEISELRKSALSNYAALKLCYEIMAQSLKEEEFKISGTLKTDKENTSFIVKEGTIKAERKKYFVEEFQYATQMQNKLIKDTVWNLIRLKVSNGMHLFNSIKDDDWYLSYSAGDIGDAREISLKVTDKKGNVLTDLGPTTIKGYGQLKVDVSAGYLMAFRGDENYTITPDVNGKNAGISKQKTSTITHNVGLLIHAYTKRKSDIDYSVTGGFSLPVDGNLNFFLGGSALFNSSNRLVLSGGISLIRSKVLNTANLKPGISGRSYDFISETNTQMIYDNVYRPAAFVSISFNFASVKK